MFGTIPAVGSGRAAGSAGASSGSTIRALMVGAGRLLHLRPGRIGLGAVEVGAAGGEEGDEVLLAGAARGQRAHPVADLGSGRRPVDEPEELVLDDVAP